MSSKRISSLSDMMWHKLTQSWWMRPARNLKSNGARRLRPRRRIIVIVVQKEQPKLVCGQPNNVVPKRLLLHTTELALLHNDHPGREKGSRRLEDNMNQSGVPQQSDRGVYFGQLIFFCSTPGPKG